MKQFFTKSMLLIAFCLVCANVFAGGLEDMGYTPDVIGNEIDMAEPSVFFQHRQEEAKDMIKELEIASLPTFDDVPLNFSMPKKSKR